MVKRTGECLQDQMVVRFARQHGIEDAVLCAAIADAETGLIDADLGGGVLKQRIARPNEGKSGGLKSGALVEVRCHEEDVPK